MSDLPWFRFFASDWLTGTRGMSAAETGIYITLIASMYDQAEPLVDDPKRLARLCGATPTVFKATLEILIHERKITRDENGLWNDRVEIELNFREGKSQAARKGSNARWGNKGNENNGGGDANAMPSQCGSDASQSQKERKKEPPAIAAGTDFSKGLTGKKWIWSEGVDHIIKTSDCNQHQARSKIGYLLKMCDEKPDRLMKFFIEALEQGSTNPEASIKTQAGKRLSAPAGAEHIQVVAIPSHDERYKRLQDRHLKENGKRKFQANGVAHFPKDWVDGLSAVSGNA